MNAPDAADLRPGDVVKVRGTLNPVHGGARAIVVSVHRDPGAPREVEWLEVRYSARGTAVRVDLTGPGDLARWDEPWPAPAAPPQREAPAPVTAVADVTAPTSRRRAALVAAALVVPVAGVLVWQSLAPSDRAEHRYAAETDRVVTGGGLDVGAEAPGAGDPTGSPLTPSPTPTRGGLPTGEVVAYDAGDGVPQPVVSVDGAAAAPAALAGVEPADGCRDAFAAELLRVLPVGTDVTARTSASGVWRTTDGGVDVNAALVRAGVATPAGEDGDALRGAAQDAPDAC